MRDSPPLPSTMTASTSDTDAAKSYTMQVLLEEVATLRKRVRQLEADEEGSNDSPTEPTEIDSSEKAHLHRMESEVSNLRKLLAKSETERADLEMDFMNQMSALARENKESVDELQSKLDRLPQDKEALAKGVDTPDDRDDVIQQLRDDVAAAEKELKVNRRDMKDMEDQIGTLEYEKSTLIDEITDTRLDCENESKMVASLRSEIDQMAKLIHEKEEKLKTDVRSRDETIRQQTDAFAEVNDNMAELEGQKGLLLDEITSLRMMMDRDDKVKANLREHIEKLTVGDQSPSSQMESLQQTVDDLQEELKSITKSYKVDVARLDETVASRDAKISEYKEKVQEKDRALRESESKVDALEDEVTQLKWKLEGQAKLVAEKEHELASMLVQRVSYEKQTNRNIMDSASELDQLRSSNRSLKDEISTLKRKLENEKTAASKLRAEPASPTPGYGIVRSPIPASPKRQRAPATPPTTPPRSYLNQSVQGAPSPVRNVSPHTKVGGLVAHFERNNYLEDDHGPQSTHSTVDTTAEQAHSIPGLRSPQHHAAFVQRNQIQRPPTASSIPGERSHLQQQLDAKCDEVCVLKEKLDKQSETVGELRASMAALSATRAAMETAVRKEFEQKSRDDQEEISSLQNELLETKRKLAEESQLVEGLKREIEQLTSQRVDCEEQAMSSYEKRSVNARKSKDAEVNKLKVELTNMQVSKAEMERDYELRVKDLETEIDEINGEVEEELEKKQRELDDIQRELEGQKDQVTRLQKEREQLCTSMNSMSHSRKDEIDDLQAELMEETAKAAAFQRELQSLKMQITVQKDSTEEVKQLKRQIREIERTSRSSTMAYMGQVEAEELREANDELRRSVQKVTQERRSLQEKLSAAVSDKSSSNSMKVLTSRNEALKKEVGRLSRKLKQMEGTITRVSI